MKKKLIISMSLALSLFLSACGGGNSDSDNDLGAMTADTIPDSYQFDTQTEVELDINIDSQATSIMGINSDTPISIIGGLYSIDGGSFTDSNGVITNQQNVVMRVISSDQNNTSKIATLNIGGVEATFTVVTKSEIPASQEALQLSSIIEANITNTSADIQWQTNLESKGQVKYGKTTNLGKSTIIENELSLEHSFILTNLESSTQYYYQVLSSTEQGEESVSDIKTFITKSGNETPVPDPLELQAISEEKISMNSAEIHWQTNLESKGQVEYGKTSSLGKSTVIESEQSLDHTFILMNLESSTQYYYKVLSSTDQGEQRVSDIKTFTTEPSDETPAPDPLELQAISEEKILMNSVEIHWQTNLASKSQIEYGKSSDLGLIVTENTLARDHQFTLINLDRFTQYYYRVRSSTEQGEERVSEIKSFKTNPHDVDLSSAVLASSFGFDPINSTEALRDAINSQNPVVVIDKQDTDWIIDPLKLFSVTDKTIIVEEGVTIKARENAFDAETAILLNFSLPKNVKFLGYGATLTMNKHEYTTGEGRHALTITGAENFTIEGFTISDSGGDGMYIAGSVPPFRNYSENVYVDNVIFDNNRRQGMSIISAQNVFVTNSTFSNTKGTLPEAGVDLEPNTPDQRLVNINFDNCRFVKNNHAGFVVATINMDSNSLPISVTVKNSYFSMNHDISNRYSTGELAFGADRHNPVKGEVTFENIEFDGSEWGLFKSRLPAEAYTINLINIQARDMLQTSEDGLIRFEVSSYDEGDNGTLGNINIDGLTAKYSKNIPFIFVYDWSTLTEFRDVTGTNISIINPEDPVTLFYRNGLAIPETNVNITVDHL